MTLYLDIIWDVRRIVHDYIGEDRLWAYQHWHQDMFGNDAKYPYKSSIEVVAVDAATIGDYSVVDWLAEKYPHLVKIMVATMIKNNTHRWQDITMKPSLLWNLDVKAAIASNGQLDLTSLYSKISGTVIFHKHSILYTAALMMIYAAMGDMDSIAMCDKLLSLSKRYHMNDHLGRLIAIKAAKAGRLDILMIGFRWLIGSHFCENDLLDIQVVTVCKVLTVAWQYNSSTIIEYCLANIPIWLRKVAQAVHALRIGHKQLVKTFIKRCRPWTLNKFQCIASEIGYGEDQCNILHDCPFDAKCHDAQKLNMYKMFIELCGTRGSENEGFDLSDSDRWGVCGDAKLIASIFDHNESKDLHENFDCCEFTIEKELFDRIPRVEYTRKWYLLKTAPLSRLEEFLDLATSYGDIKKLFTDMIDNDSCDDWSEEQIVVMARRIRSKRILERITVTADYTKCARLALELRTLASKLPEEPPEMKTRGE